MKSTMNDTERSFTLMDDGTMDTVIRCDECGEEYRYNYDGDEDQTYQQFIQWAMTDMDEEHECGEDD